MTSISVPRWIPAWARRPVFVCFALVTFLSYFTYFHGYWNPPDVFWDENYHIASAQKYLHGTFFMEQHPPLGKLLVALGEVIIHPNAQTNQFLGTDYGTQFQGVSFAGYRFFSALLSWLTAPILFFIFLKFTKNPKASVLLSFLYVFDTALIVHSRGAMLEGPLMFFSALLVLVFFHLLEVQRSGGKPFLWLSAAFGAVFAMILTTKVLGLIFVLFALALLWKMFPRAQRIAEFIIVSGAAFLVVYIAVWQTHFALVSRINPSLPDQGYYQASEQYKSILAQGKNTSLLAFPVMIRDSLKYVTFYNRGAPRLDLCKRDENGSPFYFWPLGARTINYRWATPGTLEGQTPEQQTYSYLYLAPNPVIWWGAFAAVLLAAGLLVINLLVPLKDKLKNPFLLTVFLGVYVSYMIAISRIGRVLYLYHYFIPLFLSFVLFGLVAEELRAFGNIVVRERQRLAALLVFGVAAFIGFLYYSPLAYYQPLTDAQMSRRAIFPLWEMHCVRCEKVSGLTVPNK